jgi:hypothetical protein
MKRTLNPVLILTWLIPSVAVIASFLTLTLAIVRPDGELPEQYHWEGFKLDRDFEQAKRAADLKVRAVLSRTSSDGVCRLNLSMDGSTPDRLSLTLTHATQPSLDRTLALARLASSNEYESPCAPLPDAHWRVSLTDPKGAWSIRQNVSGGLDGWILSAQGE